MRNTPRRHAHSRSLTFLLLVDTTYGNTTYSGICPKHFYLVAAQHYVGTRQSNVVYIAGDSNLGTHLSW